MSTPVAQGQPGCGPCFCHTAGCSRGEKHHHIAAHSDYQFRKAGVRRSRPNQSNHNESEG